MVLFQPSEYPVTFDFLKSLDLVATDDDGRYIMPNMQQLIDEHFEHTEDAHRYLVSNNLSFLTEVYMTFLGCTYVFGADSAVFSSFFDSCVHQRVYWWFSADKLDLSRYTAGYRVSYIPQRCPVCNPDV